MGVCYRGQTTRGCVPFEGSSFPLRYVKLRCKKKETLRYPKKGIGLAITVTNGEAFKEYAMTLKNSTE
jgi:hypothetical protein